METPIAEELNGYTIQVIKPAITLAGVTALSHAFEFSDHFTRVTLQKLVANSFLLHF